MVLIWSFHVQLFTIFCLFISWSSSTYGSESSNFGIIPTPTLTNHRFGSQRITFPEPAAADKYDFLFQATLPLPRKPHPGKDLKYKPYFFKPKPIFGYNYRKFNAPPRIPFFPPYVHKGSLYHLTQNVLKQSQVNQANKYNEELHDPGIKPVVENIKDDIKYDFRTKMHYYER